VPPRSMPMRIGGCIMEAEHAVMAPRGQVRATRTVDTLRGRSLRRTATDGGARLYAG
jgi:hypothetical protein